MDTKELSYEVIRPVGIISEKNNYKKEVNLISWNGRTPVYDIRGFRVGSDGKKYPLKGISMSITDLGALKKILSQIDTEE